MPSGDFFRMVTGAPVPENIDDMTRVAEHVSGKQVRVCLANPGIIDSGTGVYPVTSTDPEKAIRRAFRMSWIFWVTHIFHNKKERGVL